MGESDQLNRIFRGREHQVIAVNDCITHESKSRDKAVCLKPARIRSKAFDLLFRKPWKGDPMLAQWNPGFA